MMNYLFCTLAIVSNSFSIIAIAWLAMRLNQHTEIEELMAVEMRRNNIGQENKQMNTDIQLRMLQKHLTELRKVIEFNHTPRLFKRRIKMRRH